MKKDIKIESFMSFITRETKTSLGVKTTRYASENIKGFAGKQRIDKKITNLV